MVQINKDQPHHITVLDEPDAHTGIALEFHPLHSSIAPILLLPEEVLVMVFKAGTQEQGPDFAVLVSHISRSWRNVALATPQIWATIRFRTKFKHLHAIQYESYPETGLERTAAFLARSKSSPLNLHIRHFLATDFKSRSVQLLSDHFGHCRHLSITADGPDNLPAALTYFSRHPGPLLESFKLGLERNLLINFELKEPLFPSGVPHLITAQINMLDFSTFHFCLTALQSVTSLRLTDLYIEDGDDHANTSFREGLMALPSLTHLELQESYVEVNLSRPPIVLPTLQVLHASSSYTYGFLDFLAPSIYAASLTVLALQGGKPITELLEVHFPSLRHLILLEVTREVPDLGILSRFPTIERLTCTHRLAKSDQSFQFCIADVLAALGPGPHDGDTAHRIPCPRLHTVAVSAACGPLAVLALTAQIYTLRDNGIPIRKLMLPKILFAQAGVDRDDMAQLRAIVEVEDFRADWSTPFTSERFT